FRSFIITLVFFFFFSSRRRHTRSKRDWSSDVCSSDLYLAIISLIRLEKELRVRSIPFSYFSGTLSSFCVNLSFNFLKKLILFPRSEERRVGKECRSRWSRYP